MSSSSGSLLHNRILAALQGGNGLMVKRALQYRGLTRGSGDDIEELATRIENYVTDGKLGPGDVERMLREMHECGAKHVYLLRGDPGKMGKVQPTTLDNLVASLDDARVMLRPKKPHCNYSYVDATQIRLSYSEVHRRPRMMKVSGDWTAQMIESTRVIVIHADLKTGLVTIALDPPAGEHPHGDRALDYVAYYHVLAGQLLDAELFPLQWYDQLAALEHDDHREIVSVSTQRGQDKQGMDYFLSGGDADLRDYDGFRDRVKSVALRKHGKVAWQRTKADAPPAAEVLLRGEALLRTVRTVIYASPAMVKFEQHTLPQEMTYVLDFVRRLA